MKKNIYYLETGTLIFFLINSFFINIGINTLTSSNYNDSIIDIIFGMIFIFIFLLIILKLRKYYNMDIVDIINSFKYLKYPLFIILGLILIISIIYSLNTLVNFIHYYMLKDTDTLTIYITLIICIFYIVSKGLPTIKKVSEIFFYIYIFIFIVGYIGLGKYININNIKPIFISNINSHFKTSFNFLYYMIYPIFLILGIKPDKNKKDNLLIFILVFISGLIIFFETLLVLSVLGINLTNFYLYPDIIIYKRISFLNILERVEVFLAFNQLLNGLFFIIINIYLLNRIINIFIKKKKEFVSLTLLGIILLFLNNILTLNKNNYLSINYMVLIILITILIKFLVCKYILHFEDHS